jgi:hypothetical protein
LLLVELLFNLTAKFVASLGDRELNILAHTLFEVVGFAPKLLFNIGLKLLGNVLFESEAPTFIFNLEAGFSLLESLPQLLFKAGSNASAELFLTLS